MENRREFLKLLGLGVSSLTIPVSIYGGEEFSDYKALVVIYNSGGNDGLNTFIPSSDDNKTGYPMYEKIRENIRVANNNLKLELDGNGELDLSGGNPYNSNNSLKEGYLKGFYKHKGLNVATNSLMPEVAHLVNKGKVAVVLNCGNLIAPATKSELLSGAKLKPPFLFAHNHQTRLVMNGEAGVLKYSGWAGRLFDNWIDVNNGDIYGMNISIGRGEHLFYGEKTTPITIGTKGIQKYSYLKRELYENYLKLEESDIFQNLYKNKRKHSFKMEEIISDDFDNNSPTFSSLNSYGDKLFSIPTDKQLQQDSSLTADIDVLQKLEAVAKLAYIGKNRGLKRQIFFIYNGGYDTHSSQTSQHAKKLRGLSLGIGDFYKAMEELKMEKEVTLFNISDFGRSSGDNGDGTDHAWGGSYFVVGGAVKGGEYGTMPDLTLGSDDDLTKKGRLIPTLSFSQYYATLIKWFGANDILLNKLFPELTNFSIKDLGFMDN